MHKVFIQGFIAIAALLTLTSMMTVMAFSDTLVLKNGDQISGYYEGGTSRVIRFRTELGLGEYDLLTVEEIRFGGDLISSTPSVVEPLDNRSEGRQFERETRLESPGAVLATAASTEF